MAEMDPEIQAMAQLTEALSRLDDKTRARVLEWAAKRYGVLLPGGGGGGIPTDAIGETDQEAEEEAAASSGDERLEYEHFVDLFDAATPSSAQDRALVGAYWFQVLKGGGTFTATKVNNLLKDAGHGMDNITRELDRLQGRTPALVRQTAKSGRTKQARKTYKVTTAGIAAVEAMVKGTVE